MRFQSGCMAIAAVVLSAALGWAQQAESPATVSESPAGETSANAAPAAEAEAPSPSAELKASGEPAKPLLVISLAGYDKLLDDLDRLGRMTGRPGLKEFAEGMAMVMTGSNLPGLDRKRPWGAVVTQSPENPASLLAFLPVTNAGQLVQSLEPLLGTAEDAGEGIQELSGNLPRPIYIKPTDAWLYIALTPEELASLPADPVALLGQLNEEYDIGLRANLSLIPAELRQSAIEQVRAGAAMGLQPMPNEVPEQRALRERVTNQWLDQIAGIINEVEEVTVGWGLEDDEMFAEFQATAAAGSDLAAQMNVASEAETRLAGLNEPNAAVRVAWAGPVVEADVERAQANLSQLQSRVLAQLDKQNLSDGDREAAKKAIGAMFEVAGDTIALGKADGGATVMVDKGQATVLLASMVADGRKLQAAVDQLLALVRKDHPNLDDVVKTDFATIEGVTLHKVTLPVAELGLPEDRQKLVASALGDPVDLIVGIGPSALYVAVGPTALESLTAAIEQSVERGPTAIPPAEVVISARRVAELLANVADDAQMRQQAQTAAELLAQPGRSDQVVVTVSAIENGSKIRMAIAGGVLEAITASMTPPRNGGRGSESGADARRQNPRPDAPLAPPAPAGAR